MKLLLFYQPLFLISPIYKLSTNTLSVFEIKGIEGIYIFPFLNYSLKMRNVSVLISSCKLYDGILCKRCVEADSASFASNFSS